MKTKRIDHDILMYDVQWSTDDVCVKLIEIFGLGKMSRFKWKKENHCIHVFYEKYTYFIGTSDTEKSKVSLNPKPTKEKSAATNLW